MTRAQRQRADYVDSVRGWAIVLMVAIHSVRAVLDRVYCQPDHPDMTSVCNRFVVAGRAFMFATEPYISALFLTVSGYAMVVVSERLEQAQLGHWRRRRLAKAAQLAVMSWAILWFHMGISLPYPFLSAEILYNIGVGIAATLWFVCPSRRNGLALGAIVLVGALWTLFAEARPDHALALAAQGPGAHLPNLLFFPLGILFAWLGRGALRWRWLVVPGALAVILLYHQVVAPPVVAEQSRGNRSVTSVEVLWNRPFGRTTARREIVVDRSFGSLYDLKWLGHRVGLQGKSPPRIIKARYFWNKRLVLVPLLAAWVALTFALAWAPWWRRRLAFLDPVRKPLRLVGRHALAVYLFHLSVIAGVVAVVGRNRWSAGETGAFFLALLGLSLGLSWLLEWRAARLRTSSAQGDSHQQ